MASTGESAITTSFSGCPHHLDDGEILLEIEAGRHTASGWQHLAWIDTDTETPGLQIRTAIFRANPPELDWNMRAATSAPLADGTDTLVYDGSTTFARALPAVAAGEYVPPPFVTLVARTFDAGGNKLDESSTTLCIPQYVQITWDAAVIEEFRQQIVFDYPGASGLPPTNVMLFAGCTAAVATAAFDGIAAKVQAMFPSGANIVVVGPNVNVPQPHKTMVIQTGQYVDPVTGASSKALGRTPNEHCHQRNDSPSGTAYVYGGTIHNSLSSQYLAFYADGQQNLKLKNDWRNVLLPLSADLIADYIAQVALHECCHSMGLVPTASSDGDGHNRCICGGHFMDDGGYRGPPVYLGFVQSLVQFWKPENKSYLEFVFPVSPGVTP